ncbi:MAG TPA: heavy-metal-associated domain-containing protein [Candidatus Mediterraneibacter excrementigallinarum]|nr:heavy-metal-associated domain-containing protein [Candidatus Mediterraneibacter excrementigallinarum]
MVNVIIVLILVVLLSFAVKSSIRHFKGEGACCGGGSGTVKTKKPKKKKLDGPVVAKRTVEISGMHCQNCANSVTRALNGIDGVAARVNLHANRAEVLMDRMVDEDELKHAVEEAGYGVVDIKAS